MFICDSCNKPSKRMNKKIIKKRERKYYIVCYALYRQKGKYYKTFKVQKERQEFINWLETENKLGRTNGKVINKNVSEGWEIEQELNICDKCKEIENE